ncbi:MAG: starch-binding protein [Lachnospiraceae bacterium]|nr:starch-binding protein [Lachnospiraceae bacterium]
MKDLFKSKKLIIAIITIALAVSGISLGFLGKSKASTDNLQNYGSADNNDHSSDTIYTVTLDNNNKIKYAADDLQNGVILQAWCWSFNTIKELMPQIKAAGYSCIQTSPINKCVIGNTNSNYDLSISNWYYHYQPTNFTIGNYQLGSEEEFIEMCKVADQYGIKVIVDVALNHMANAFNYIDGEWRDYSNFRTNQKIYDWSSRYNQTHYALEGLWDLETGNHDIQKKLKSFLENVLADGAYGFRYDAAKHIELPDDESGATDFWPNIVNNGAKYQYGEVLGDESTARTHAYVEYLDDVCTEGTGYTLRSAIANNNFSTDNILSYNAQIDNNYLVTWVESHDNFNNDSMVSTWLTDEQITLCWAELASRAETTPLFYPRPVGAGGTYYDSRYPGLSKIGDEGSSLYKSEAVAEVNIFRNMMEGESEYLRNINDEKVLMIERGKKGAVIINLNYENTSISSPTYLADNVYTSHTHADNNGTYKVEGGTLTGTLPARSVTVLYDDNNSKTPVIGIEGYNTSTNNIFTSDYAKLTLTASNAKYATYSINGGNSYLYENGKDILIGWGYEYNKPITIELRAQSSSGITTSETYTFIKKSASDILYVEFEKPSDWGSTVYAYMYKPVGSTTMIYSSWTGTAMNHVNGNLYNITLDAADYVDGYIMFNDGNNQVPGSGKDGFKLKNYSLYNANGYVSTNTPSPATMAPTVQPTTTPTVAPTVVPTTAPTVQPTVAPTDTPSGDITIRFNKPSGWGNSIYAYIYTAQGSNVTSLKSWPGTKMSVYKDSTYTITFDSKYRGGYIIFNDKSSQTPDSNKPGFIIEASALYDYNGFVEYFVDDPTPTPAPTAEPTLAPTVAPTVQPTVAPTMAPSTIEIQFKKPSGWGSKLYAYIYSTATGSTKIIKKWPGEDMTSIGNDVYSIKFEDSYNGGNVIFSDGNNQIPASGKSGFIITAGGYYTIDGYKRQIDEEEPTTYKIYYYAPNWNSCNIHYKLNNASWTTAPGVKMESAGNGYYVIEITPGTSNSITFCFNNGSSWDNNKNSDYKLTDFGTYTINNYIILSGTP